MSELHHSEEGPKEQGSFPQTVDEGKQIFILLRHQDLEIVTAAFFILTPASSFWEV